MSHHSIAIPKTPYTPVGQASLLLPPMMPCLQANLRVCEMSSSVSGTISHLPLPSRMATCNSGTSDVLTDVRGCSQPIMGLSSAATGTLRTGVMWGCGGSRPQRSLTNLRPEEAKHGEHRAGEGSVFQRVTKGLGGAFLQGLAGYRWT